MTLPGLLGLALMLAVAATLAAIQLHFGATPTVRAEMAKDIFRSLVSFVLVTVIGSMLALMGQLYMARRAREAALVEEQAAMLRRLVGVANILRRIPANILSEPSQARVQTQIPLVVDARVELHLILHEGDAFAVRGGANMLFPNWKALAKNIQSMRAYLVDLEGDMIHAARGEADPPLLVDLLHPERLPPERSAFRKFITDYTGIVLSMKTEIARSRRIT
jgi:hypothetical protein